MFDTGVVLLEVFLFDFSGDLYGRTLDVAVIAWIRPEFKFDTVDDARPPHGRGLRIARMALARAGDAFPPLGAVTPVVAGADASGAPRRLSAPPSI